MTLNQAYNILEQETEFLGIDWEKLLYLLRTNPMMFPQRALKAYDRILEDIGELCNKCNVLVLEE